MHEDFVSFYLKIFLKIKETLYSRILNKTTYEYYFTKFRYSEVNPLFLKETLIDTAMLQKNWIAQSFESL